MADPMKFTADGITLKAKLKPVKAAVNVSSIVTDSDHQGGFTRVLESFVRHVEGRGEFGKIYVTVPAVGRFEDMASKAGFEAEARYLNAFHCNGSHRYVDGIDMVYFLDAGRRIGEEKRASISEFVEHIKASQHHKNHLEALMREGYVIRRGTPDDLGGIASVLNGCFLFNDDEPVGASAEGLFGDLADTIWMVSLHGDKVVGAAAAYLDDGESKVFGYQTRMCEIADCAVLPEHRQKGIMTELVRGLSIYAFSQDQVPFAYCAAQQEGMQRVMASLWYEQTGISAQTNRLLFAEDDVEKPATSSEIPFSNNVVWFKPGSFDKL